MTVPGSSRAAAPPVAAQEGIAGKDRIAGGILLAALVIGLARFFRLAEWSLWFDEAATWTDWHVGLDGGEISNPLGYHAIALVVRMLGGTPDEFSLRLLPAIAGWCAIPLTWWAFRPFAGSRRAAAAALIVAASSWQVYWSQNARFYTLAQAVSLFGAGLVLQGMWSGVMGRALLGLALAAGAALLHPSCALLCPALVLAPWIVRATRTPMPAGSKRVMLALLIVSAAGLLATYGWAQDALENYWRQKGTSDASSEFPQMIARVEHHLLTCGFYFTPLLGTAALVGGWLALRQRDPFHLLALCVSACVVLTTIVFAIRGARMTAQYVFFLMPWVAILACAPMAGLEEAAKSSREALLSWSWLALLLAPALVTCGLYFTVRKGERPQWREAYEFVWNRREENDLILGMEATVGEFYLAPLRTDLRQPVHVAWLDKWRARVPEQWALHARRSWYIFNPEQLLDWAPEDAADFQRFLREQCRLVKTFPLYVESRDLSISIYIRG